jgi:hypothetical protein
LVVLYSVKHAVNHALIQHSGGAVSCTEDNRSWCFTKCSLATPVFITHVFTTMQTAAIVKIVFIKTTKKFTYTQAFEALGDDLRLAAQDFLQHQTQNEKHAHENDSSDSDLTVSRERSKIVEP